MRVQHIGKIAVVCLAVLALIVVPTASISAANPPTVDGLFYGLGDDARYLFLNSDPGRGELYYYLDGTTLYVAVVVDRSVNDNVFGDGAQGQGGGPDRDYLLDADWTRGAGRTASELIQSDNTEFTLACGATSWTWNHGYVYDSNGDEDPDEADWLSGPGDGSTGGGTPPSGLTSASSLQWNLNNTLWDVTLGNTRGSSDTWKSVDDDDDNEVTDEEGYPATGDITYDSTNKWEWPLVYEFSVDLSHSDNTGCTNSALSIEVISAHNSPSKDGDEDVPIEETDLVDYGDAPDTYGTLLVNSGARHTIIANNPFLGAGVDAETDGQPNATATGDDSDGNDDEDGVVFTTALVPGTTAGVDVTASVAGQLDAWVDFNGDGDFDTGEQIFTNVSLGAGVNSLTFPVPSDATEGTTYARFRFSSAGGLSPTGPADDGEVEDYEVLVADQDFGDLPGVYNLTTFANNGARHIIGNLFLGDSIDPEANGQDDANALGDDNNDTGDDEDGIERDLTEFWEPGNTVHLDVEVTEPGGTNGYLVCWIDWDRSDAFEADEKIEFGAVNDGLQTLSLTIPSDYNTGDDLFVRCRLFDGDPGTPEPTGSANNGEVEDYFWEFGPSAVTLARLDATSVAGFPAGLTVAALAFLAGTVAVGGVLVRRRKS